MPELPDVEVYKQYIQSTSLHQVIDEIDLRSPELLGETRPDTLKNALLDDSFQSCHRHGKYLFLRLNEGYSLILHFGMTGFPEYFGDKKKAPSHVRLLLAFKNGFYFAYDCQRKLGLIDLTDNEQDFIKRKNLGYDPYHKGFSWTRFKHILTNRRGSIKSALMNQNLIAGIGNIYSDEILFQAGIHPKTAVNTLSREQLKLIYEKMNDVFQRSIKALSGHDAFPSDYLIPHRKPGEACPVCSGRIVKQTLSGRSAYFCSKHQDSDS